MNNYDAIIVGAGSVGVPAALALGAAGLKTLVLDEKASPGQGENKHAIGGIRATHSAPAKILVGLQSLKIFTTWQSIHGDSIEWLKGGYLFPVYRAAEEIFLKGILPLQKKYGLNIDFIDAAKVRTLVPGINPDGLIGGTFSPDDGTASPLLAIQAFYRKACSHGVEFRFKEKVIKLLVDHGKVMGVATAAGRYRAEVVVDAAGGFSPALCATAGVKLPVTPESHEGAITEPVQPFFQSMIVDLRPAEGSKNYYFYQNLHGQVVFCITPDPPIIGTDKRETSVFLPQVSRRMVSLIPRLKNLRVRRVWRGLYPMTPDGSPLVGWSRQIHGLLHLSGMCGQGFMLGPGFGQLAARMLGGTTTDDDLMVLKEFAPQRPFGGEEALK
jgi:sarcosine oxidase subunit beta